ncbi:MAG TPA: DUF6314 family protein [Mycobacteriales bacterium]|nr:DUF6314 family protein [Mycobacteriales bacterium]
MPAAALTRPGPADLVGRWRLVRRVADRAAGAQGTVTGLLTVSADGAGFRWDEHGTLVWAGVEHPVSRTYLLRERAGGWWVDFEDGRSFHPWRPGAPVTHPCRADVYSGLITVDADRIRTVWDVRGPGKHQRLVTRLYRSAAIDSGVSVGS